MRVNFAQEQTATHLLRFEEIEVRPHLLDSEAKSWFRGGAREVPTSMRLLHL